MNKWREHYKKNQQRTRNYTQNPTDQYRQIQQGLQQFHLGSIDEEEQSSEISTSQVLDQNQRDADDNDIHTEEETGDQQLTDNQVNLSDEPNHQINFGRVSFHDWLSIISYSFALTIVTALYLETNLFGSSASNYRDEAEYTPDRISAERPRFLTEGELLNINSTDTGDLIERLIGTNTQSQDSFLNRLDTLYIIILSVLTGYLEALRQYRA